VSDHHHEQKVPRGAIIGGAVLLVASMGLAANARSAHLAEPPPVQEPAREEVMLHFEDRPGGALAILEAATGREVTTVSPGTNGFIRGVLRGMFRERRRDGLARDGEFRLAREADGRLTLQDPETHQRVDLDSFGPTNSAAFAAVLVAARAPR
jgi:putative photosynthetic complex assembly protein